MNFTKKQHYLSRYVLKRFINNTGKIDAVILPSVKKISSNINDICVEKDFYEDKYKDGQYINRNRTENKFATIESDIANKLEYLFQILNCEDHYEKLKGMHISGEWDYLSVFLMLHLTLVIIRSPVFKEIVFNKDELPLEIKQIFYKEFLFGKEEAKILAINQFQDEELKLILKMLEESNIDGGINILMNNLINNYFIELYQSPANKKFFLSDNPVIINGIDGIDYFMPISPYIAISMKRFPNVNKVKYKTHIIHKASEKMIDNINRFIVTNANRVIIVQNMGNKEFEFIKENLDL